MKKEKIILSFIAVALGLAIAGGIYYFYQSSKMLSDSDQKATTVKKQDQVKDSGIFLSLSEPSDEAVFDKKVITISGKTLKEATIVVLTENDQQVIKPTSAGDFSTTVNIENGQNIITITAVAENGEQKTVLRTVTFSTEEF